MYPQIRIPYLEEAQYYLDVLAHKMDISSILKNMKDCIEEHGEIGSYKMRKFDEIVAHFKESGMMEQFNNVPLYEHKSDYPKQFNNWKEDKVYISMDVNEANWSIFKHAIGSDLPKWTEFVKQFDLHPFIAESKSYRQLVFGNLNPSRQQSFQKKYMSEVVGMWEKTVWGKNIVMLSPDEILFELAEGEHLTMMNCVDMQAIQYALPLAMKTKVYCIKRVTNFGDSISIKYQPRTDKPTEELFAVNGNRFFIHFKSIILKEPLDDRDLYFEPEPKKLAKWIL